MSHIYFFYLYFILFFAILSSLSSLISSPPLSPPPPSLAAPLLPTTTTFNLTHNVLLFLIFFLGHLLPNSSTFFSISFVNNSRVFSTSLSSQFSYNITFLIFFIKNWIFLAWGEHILICMPRTFRTLSALADFDLIVSLLFATLTKWYSVTFFVHNKILTYSKKKTNLSILSQSLSLISLLQQSSHSLFNFFIFYH